MTRYHVVDRQEQCNVAMLRTEYIRNPSLYYLPIPPSLSLSHARAMTAQYLLYLSKQAS